MNIPQVNCILTGFRLIIFEVNARRIRSFIQEIPFACKNNQIAVSDPHQFGKVIRFLNAEQAKYSQLSSNSLGWLHLI